MHQLCREFVLAKRIAAGLIQIGQPLVLKQQKQESLDWTAVSPETTETGVAALFYTVLFNGALWKRILSIL